MYSYSRKEYQVSHGEPLPERFPFILIPASRDVRIFIISLGALAGLAFPAMLLAGSLSHLAVATRLFAGRPRKQRRAESEPVVTAVDPSPEIFSAPAEPEGAPTFAE